MHVDGANVAKNPHFYKIYILSDLFYDTFQFLRQPRGMVFPVEEALKNFSL
jgi:hypothetical protein